MYQTNLLLRLKAHRKNSKKSGCKCNQSKSKTRKTNPRSKII